MAQAAVARSLSPTSELSKSYISPRLKGREVFPFGLTAYPNRVGTAEVREENGISAPCGPKPAFAGGVMPAFLLDCSDRRGIRTSVATTNINQPFSGLHFFILNLPLPLSLRNYSHLLRTFSLCACTIKTNDERFLDGSTARGWETAWWCGTWIGLFSWISRNFRVNEPFGLFVFRYWKMRQNGFFTFETTLLHVRGMAIRRRAGAPAGCSRRDEC